MKHVYVVRHSFLVVHTAETEDPGEGYGEYPDGLSWHFTENRCSGNVVDDLACMTGLEDGVCRVCSGHSAKFLGRYASVEEARKVHPFAVDLHEGR